MLPPYPTDFMKQMELALQNVVQEKKLEDATLEDLVDFNLITWTSCEEKLSN